MPLGDVGLKRRDIRYLRRNGLKRRLAGKRQAKQRTVEIVTRQRLFPCEDFLYAAHVRQQPDKRLLDFEHDGCSLRGEKRRVTQELNRVAQALLGVQQNRLAVEQFLSQPERRAVVAALRGEPAHMPARLVGLP